MLKLGDILQGKLVEQLDESHWIVSIDGHLIQVVNNSELKFQKNKVVDLQVKTENPIEFKVLGLARKQGRGINVRV